MNKNITTTPSNEASESAPVRYVVPPTVETFKVRVPWLRVPSELLLSVEAASENGAFYMRAIEVDVAVEGETPLEALLDLLAAVRGWLEYLREEMPKLAPDLEPQRRYVALLNYEPSGWIRPFVIT